MSIGAGVRSYFSPPPRSIWLWSTDGEVIETRDGHTIAFREEILTLLKRLQPDGLPPFECLVLVMLAIRGKSGFGRLCRLDTYHPQEEHTLRSLRRLGALPEQHLSNAELRESLVALVFDRFSLRRDSGASLHLLRVFAEGIPAEELRELPDVDSPPTERFRQWRVLADALDRVDERTLESWQKAGLIQLPVAQDEAEEPEEEQEERFSVVELLQQLEQDEEHSGFVRLVRRLMAMVHLPRTMQPEEELPVGGVSDIANRGPFDRLLLSELAYDDDTLTTRIALNEALYLRRETPPNDPRQQRLIVLDCGIRMWGLPRLYASAAAMALLGGLQRRSEFTDETTQVMRPVQARLEPVDLGTREGVIDQLAVLRPEPHFGSALPEVARLQLEGDRELVFVTCPETWQDAAFQQALRENELDDCYLFLVGRDGTLELRRISRKGSKLIRRSQHEIAELLEKREQPNVELVNPRQSGRWPAIFYAKPFPLLVPSKIDWNRAWYLPGHGVLSLVSHGRLLLWREDDNHGQKRGPRQIATSMPHGVLHWHDNHLAGENLVQIVVGDDRTGFILVNCNTRSWEVNCIPLDDLQKTSVCRFSHHLDILFAVSGRDVIEFSRHTGKQISSWTLPPDAEPLSGSRFFRRKNNSQICALAKGGTLQPVPFKMIPQPATLAWIGESANGPVLFTADGMRVTTEEAVRISAGKTHLAGMSPCKRFVAFFEKDLHNDARVYDIEQHTFTQHKGVDSWNYLKTSGVAFIKEKSLALRFTHIGLHQGRLGVFNAGRNGFGMALTPDLVWQDKQQMKWHRSNQAFGKAAPSDRDLGTALRSVTWPDGSKAWLDDRGLLHLQSSDQRIPEFTLVLHHGPCSGWCADGRRWGLPYFHVATAQLASPQEIHQSLIKPFLDQLPH